MQFPYVTCVWVRETRTHYKGLLSLHQQDRFDSHVLCFARALTTQLRLANSHNILKSQTNVFVVFGRFFYYSIQLCS